MPEVTRVEIFKLSRIVPAVKTRRLYRGQGRRLNALPAARRREIPEFVVVGNTSISHELHLVGSQRAEFATYQLQWHPDHESLLANWMLFPAAVGTYCLRHEVYEEGEEHIHKHLGNPMQALALLKRFDVGPKEALILHLKQAQDIGRETGRPCRVVLTGGRAYHLLNWTDVFGASIKETDMTKTIDGNRVHFVGLIGPTQTKLVVDAQSRFFDGVTPFFYNLKSQPELSGSAHDLLKATAKDLTGLPVLADAMEESGFTEPNTLAHLRHYPAHGQMCWALAALRARYRAIVVDSADAEIEQEIATQLGET